MLADGAGSAQQSQRPSVVPPDLSAEIEAFIEGVSELILLCAGSQVISANETARKLLGQHAVDGDVRLAMCHPTYDQLIGAILVEDLPLELAGLGTHDQRWEIPVTLLEEDVQVVHLSGSSGARAAERMRVDFVANTNRESCTPLAAILGFIATLPNPSAGGVEETRSRFLEIIDKEARRMHGLIDELMALSQIGAEKYRAPMTISTLVC